MPDMLIKTPEVETTDGLKKRFGTTDHLIEGLGSTIHVENGEWRYEADGVWVFWAYPDEDVE